MPGISISEDPWRFFVNSGGTIDYNEIHNSEWQWLVQSQKVVEDDQLRHYVELRTMSELTFVIFLSHNKFCVKFSRTPEFPEEEPRITGSYTSAFSFEWDFEGSRKTLKSVIREYIDFAKVMDFAIGQFDQLSREEYVIKSLDVDENYPECLTAEIVVPVCNETLWISVEWAEPQEFPRKLRLSNPSRLQKLNCDEWNVEQSIAQNLRQIFNNGFELDSSYRH
ncbi:unnamed protein product [Caenorhabditis auriculariae]|uniref:Uncharacterized protein n=1 Tax=Caenorhabditis auriculariae TaxID=2777116 RepID=A0A8S1HUP2_9PELO|nr:unnamed protein product [Caenorhabditis auriculariae]